MCSTAHIVPGSYGLIQILNGIVRVRTSQYGCFITADILDTLVSLWGQRQPGADCMVIHMYMYMYELMCIRDEQYSECPCRDGTKTRWRGSNECTCISNYLARSGCYVLLSTYMCICRF